ncbi:hypothetical protein SpCBS45565_g08088 [Spizellomyces sp. 'palustris']|nr:hypothetical protein SpCBS45565_g08088 [Spizellomyces sp. 'palustris']
MAEEPERESVAGSSVAKLMVSVRIRPLSLKELAKENLQITARSHDDHTVLVTEPTPDQYDDVLRKDRPKERIYAFDQVFGEGAQQDQVFDKTVKYLIEWVVKGYNATVFAYGATGAGKTYTMLGTDSAPGIMALTLMDLFTLIDAHNREQQVEGDDATTQGTYTVTLSYLEIYNENIRDLLSGKADYLDLREDAQKGVVVAGITTVTAKTPEEVLGFLRKGNRHRTQEATGANEVSSRSHAVLQVLVGCRMRNRKGKIVERFGKLSLIDLAGSERAAETKNRGMRMIEGANINRSLLALGNCITALSDTTKKKGKYVNYRDSKLTRLLKDSLGGNCRTVMIANISPGSSNFDETVNTLKYASRARAIKTKVTQQVSQKTDTYSVTIQQLQSEIGLLKNRLVRAESSITTIQPRNSVSLAPRLRLIDEPLPKTPATPERSMFTELHSVLLGLFAEHQELRERFLEMEVGNNGQREEVQKQIGEVEEGIRSIEQSIPRSLDTRSRQYLELLIKSHFTSLENTDLQTLTTQQKTLLQNLTNTLQQTRTQLTHLDQITSLQRQILTTHSVDVPSKLLEMYRDVPAIEESDDGKVERAVKALEDRVAKVEGEERGVEIVGRRLSVRPTDGIWNSPITTRTSAVTPPPLPKDKPVDPSKPTSIAKLRRIYGVDPPKKGRQKAR